MFDAAADAVVAALRQTQTERPVAHFVLTGGKTAAPLYERLAAPPRRGRVDWAKVHFWWGDERFVPSDHAESNFRLAKETFLDRVPVSLANIHPMRTIFPSPESAAENYEAELRRFFPETPAFDLLLLSIGPDGHVASLFPGAPALAESVRWVVAVRGAPKPPPDRITLTLPALRAARRAFFLAIGPGKDVAYDRASAEPDLPAARAAARPEVRWFVHRGVAPTEPKF